MCVCVCVCVCVCKHARYVFLYACDRNPAKMPLRDFHSSNIAKRLFLPCRGCLKYTSCNPRKELKPTASKKRCPLYDSNLHPIVRLQFWTSDGVLSTLQLPLFTDLLTRSARISKGLMYGYNRCLRVFVLLFFFFSLFVCLVFSLVHGLIEYELDHVQKQIL